MNYIKRPQFFERKAAERDNLLQLISSRESMDRISSMSYLVQSNDSAELLEPSNMTEGLIDNSQDHILLEELKSQSKSGTGYLRNIRSREKLEPAVFKHDEGSGSDDGRE